MMTRSEVREAREAARALLDAAGIWLSQAEYDGMEAADFGLSHWREEGAQIATIVATDRVGLKIICLLPGQTLPEHWHTADGVELGKEETLRVAYGTMRLYLPGRDTLLEGYVPQGKEAQYTVRNENNLTPPQQMTLPPDTPHWMQGGPEGTVMYSISSAATCARDPFTDPAVVRMTVIMED